jgi:hypothetical protein
MAGCKPKKFAKGGMANSSGKFLTDPKSGRPTGLGPVVLEPPRRAPAPAPAPVAPPRPAPAPPMPPRPAPAAPLRAAPPPAATQTQLSAAAAQGQRVPANVAAGIQADAAKALQGFNAQRMGQGMGMGSQSVSPTQANKMGSMGAGVLGSMKPPAFKKGGMVNAKKKPKASAGKSSSVRPRGSSGKGVKACKVC